ncbi:HzsA-related protein [Paludibaculum fermentans]|uniref:Hydrazine synthase alpha subunit middle domain-containing protein n=1 Tax=Paludibaculum fermentans TaxID=1473598 RepID=A0A7S7NM95_PALFE|nr:hypothetical protein [Paludibaculum fermentans]QOY86145.1 hypothetical protein IRI77_25490 [Paludibaculum fermentans]
MIVRGMVLTAAMTAAWGADGALAAAGAMAPGSAGLVVTQARAGHGERLYLLEWTGRGRVLSDGFAAAADPDVSFDGKRILFAGRRAAGEPWQVFEMNADGGGVRQISHEKGGCRQPVYQSRIFSLDIPEPWPQVAFVCGGALYSSKLDGSDVQRLTYAGQSDTGPAMLPEGRMIYSSGGRLFGINLDGTDYALFTGGLNARTAAAVGRKVVFVEAAGQLSMVTQERPLHSHSALTAAADGVFAAPAALGEGSVVVAKKGPAGWGLWRLELATRKQTPLYDSPEFDELQAKVVGPHEQPDGRGTVVETEAPSGHLYCLSVYTSDRPAAAGSIRKVRVLTGPEAAPVRLGELAVEADGSFHLEIPANTKVKLQTLDAAGQVMRSSGWVWVRNKENRGCIGCHEDPELAPENVEAQAVIKKPVRLGLGDKK